MLAQGSGVDSLIGGLFFLFAVVVIGGLYFLPTLLGTVRKVPNIGSIVIINIFLGWTFIGWVVCLAMAARSVPRNR